MYLLIKIRRVYNRLRFGKVSLRITSMLEGTVAEYEILDRKGRVVGYWAYGYYDPNYPYKDELG